MAPLYLHGAQWYPTLSTSIKRPPSSTRGCCRLKNIAKSRQESFFVATKNRAKRTIAERQHPSTCLRYRTLARRYPNQLPHHPQSREENGNHRQDDKGRHFRQPFKARETPDHTPACKLEKNLGQSPTLTVCPQPSSLLTCQRAHIAVAEANRLGIPVFGIVDTNSNLLTSTSLFPQNHDASKSIEVILDAICAAMNEVVLRSANRENRHPEDKEEGEAAAPENGRRVRRNVSERVVAPAEAEVKKRKLRKKQQKRLNPNPYPISLGKF